MSSAKGQAPKQKEQAPPATKPKEQAAAPKPKEQAAPAAKPKEQAAPKEKKPAAANAHKENSPQPAAKEAPKAAPKKEATPEPERNPEDEKLNPYSEVIAKRLRALKKRLVKIEKNVELQAQGHKLDQDQLKSLAQRAEVLHLITELEDISKIFVEVTFEEEKLEKAEKKRLAVEEQKKIVALKEQQQEEFKKILEPLYVLSVLGEEDARNLLTTKGVEGFSLSHEEFQTLDNLATAVYGKYQLSSGLAASSSKFFARVKKLSSKNSENIAPGLSYTAAQNLLQKISASPFFNPELAAKLAKERADREAAEEAARREQEEMQRSYEIITADEIPPFSPMSPEQMNGLPGGAPLAFIGASEVLGVQPVVSFDGSPAVVVPIPQTLFYSHIATPLYSSFRPPIHQQQQPIQPAQPQQPSHPAAQPEPAAASHEAAPSPSSSPSQPASQDGTIAPNQANQQQPQRYNHQGGARPRGTGYRGGPPPQDRHFQEQHRYHDRAPQDRSYQGYRERGQQDRPPQPRAERGGAAGGHRGGRGAYRGAKAPQAQTA